jgi:hypothetical protein
MVVAGRAAIFGQIALVGLACHFNAENRAAMTAGLLEYRAWAEGLWLFRLLC